MKSLVLDNVANVWDLDRFGFLRLRALVSDNKGPSGRLVRTNVLEAGNRAAPIIKLCCVSNASDCQSKAWMVDTWMSLLAMAMITLGIPYEVCGTENENDEVKTWLKEGSR